MSGSENTGAIVTLTPTAVSAEQSCAIGASLTGLTAIGTRITAEVQYPSLTV